MDIPCVKASYAVRGVLTFLYVVFIIGAMAMMGGMGSMDEAKGKWMDISTEEEGDYVCSKAGSCAPGTFKPNSDVGGDKCFFVGQKTKGRRNAETNCASEGFALATIESAAENKVAFDLCDKGGPRICFIGLIGWGDTTNLNNWKWDGGSTSSYRNWWHSDEHEEPTGEGEESVSFVTTKIADEISAGVFIGMMIGLVWLLIMIVCCCMNSALVWCGLTKKNKCCVCTAASLDGAMVGMMLLGSLGSFMRGGGEIFGGIFQFLIGVTFLTGSILGCMQCNKVGQIPPSAVVGPGVTMAQPIGLGQPVVGQVLGQPVQVIEAKAPEPAPAPAPVAAAPVAESNPNLPA